MKTTKRFVIVGTAGHIDHGKTSLVRQLTGIDTDRLPEERARGISIDLGFAHFDSEDVHFGLVACPEAVPGLWDLATDIRDSLAELVTAAGGRPGAAVGEPISAHLLT